MVTCSPIIPSLPGSSLSCTQSHQNMTFITHKFKQVFQDEDGFGGVCVCVCTPGVCVVDEFEKVLEVLGDANDDVLRGGDGAAFIVFGLHHTFDETQPIEL